MSYFLNFFPLDNMWILILKIIDILIVWGVIYYLISIMKHNIRMIQILKGIIILVIINVLSNVFMLKTVHFIVSLIIDWGVLLLVIIFQPEIRSGLEYLGRKSSFARKKLTINEREKLIKEVVNAVTYLSKRHIGALISIENTVLMNDFIIQSLKIDSPVSSQLITTIFTPNSTLHDGAIIIQGTKIACAGALFPTSTNPDLPPELGTRHRAALGVSEITDCITIIVSEETGIISVTENGYLYEDLKKEMLIEFLKNKLKVVDDLNRKNNSILIEK